MKVYCFFLKENPYEIYAYTITKEFSESFKKTRNMKLFIHGIKDMDDEEYRTFSYLNQSSMLTTDFITDGDNDYEMIVTYKESDMLSSSCEYIVDTIETIKTQAKNKDLFLDEDDLNFIVEITNLLICNERRGYLNINSLKVFYYICKNTFIENGDYIKNEERFINKNGF